MLNTRCGQLPCVIVRLIMASRATHPCVRAIRLVPNRPYSSALTMSSTTFLASPNTILFL